MLVEPAPLDRSPKALAADLERLADAFAGVSQSTMVHALVAWASVYGTVSFELFGQFHNVIAANGQYFDAAMAELATFVGIPNRRE